MHRTARAFKIMKSISVQPDETKTPRVARSRDEVWMKEVLDESAPKSEPDTFDLFQKYFIGEGLVDSSLAGVVAEAARSAAQSGLTFAGTPAEVTALVANVRVLYESMDASLRFKPAVK